MTRSLAFSAKKSLERALRTLFALGTFVTAVFPSAGQFISVSGVTETTLTLSTLFGGYYTGLSVQITTDPSMAAAEFSQGAFSMGGGGSIYPVYFTFTGLLPGTTYYYRGYYYQLGTVGGTVPEWRQFVTTLETPAPGPPIAITQFATEVSVETATLSAEVNPKGSQTEVRFEVGRDPTFAGSLLTAVRTLSAGLERLGVSEPVTGLQEATKYYFRVLATNDFGTSRGATRSFVTAPINQSPMAAIDEAVVTYQTTTWIDVLANDNDPEGDPLTISSAENGTHGTVLVVTITGRQWARYTPASGYSGNDSFTYRITDGFGGSAVGTVYLSIVRSNRAPVLRRDVAVVAYQTAAEIDVLANDSDPDGDPLTITAAEGGAHGITQVVTVAGSGQRVRYTPAQGFFGGDSFTYNIIDSYGGSAAGTVAVTVFPPAPELGVEQPAGNALVDATSRVDFGTSKVGESGERTFIIKNTGDGILTGVAITIDGPDAGAFAVTSAPMTVVTPGANTSFTVRSSPAARGTNQATLRLGSNDADENPFEIALTSTGENRPPVTRDDIIAAFYQTATSIDVLANDNDPDGDVLTITEVQNALFGTVQLMTGSSRQVIRYMPAAGYLGADTFRYVASDGFGGTTVGTVNLTVGPLATTLHLSGEVVPTAGDPGSGVPAGAIWENFGVPSISDNGRVAFSAKMATATETLTVVYVGSVGRQEFIGSSGYTVARKRQSANGATGATFATFKDPLLNDNGTVVFLASLDGASAATNGGIWRHHDVDALDAPTLVARKGAEPPGVPGAEWKAFTSVALSDGPTGDELIAFTANMATGPNGSAGPGGVTRLDDAGLWIVGPKGSKLALRRGQKMSTGLGIKKVKNFLALKCLPGAPGQGYGATSAGVLARVIFTDGTPAILRLAGDGIANVVAWQYDRLVASNQAMTSFGVPIQNREGEAAFIATLDGDSAGAALVKEGPAGVFAKILRTGETPAGLNAPVSTFSAVAANSTERMAFTARLKRGAATAANDIALCAVEGESAKLIAREGAQPPGVTMGAQWASFPSLALPDGYIGPVFIGKLLVPPPGTPNPAGMTAANNIGLWAVDSTGALRLIVRTGDEFDSSRKIKTLSVLGSVSGSKTQRRSINNRGEILYRATLSDGAQAIIKVTVP